MLLPCDINDWPEIWRDAYSERAAIREYDGHQPRDIAEKQAEAEMRTKADWESWT